MLSTAFQSAGALVFLEVLRQCPRTGSRQMGTYTKAGGRGGSDGPGATGFLILPLPKILTEIILEICVGHHKNINIILLPFEFCHSIFTDHKKL